MPFRSEIRYLVERLMLTLVLEDYGSKTSDSCGVVRCDTVTFMTAQPSLTSAINYSSLSIASLTTLSWVLSVVMRIKLSLNTCILKSVEKTK